MAREYAEIDETLRAWIERQALFFVGTAPLAADGHVNVSPKGPIGALRVLGPRRIGYLDVAGSGAETIAHLRENGRIVVMLCAFSGPPRIVRLHGRGEVVTAEDPRCAGLVETHGFADASIPEARRSVILVALDRISDSCGYGVPLMEYVGDREHHALSSAKYLRTGGPEAFADRVLRRNTESIDGLPAMEG